MCGVRDVRLLGWTNLNSNFFQVKVSEEIIEVFKALLLSYPTSFLVNSDTCNDKRKVSCFDIVTCPFIPYIPPFCTTFCG